MNSNFRTPTSKPIEFHVKENQVGILIGKLVYQNASANPLKFSIANQRDVTDHISISHDGSLYTQKPLDREIRDTYRLTIIAEYIKGVVTGTGIYQVIVYVDDENDNAPTFEHEAYEGKIPENSKAGTEVDLNYLVIANDADSGENGQMTVTIFGDGSEMFRLDRYTGKVYFQGSEDPLDREDKPVYNLRLVAKDKGGLYSEAKFTIKIEDENDNAPVFTQMVILPDLGIDVIEYDENKSKVELLQESRTNISGVYTLTQSHVKSQGLARNKMTPLLSVPEDIPVGSSIVRLIAQDLDLGENSVIKYEMSSETYIPNVIRASEPFHVTQYFMVHSASGEVAVARTLPPESELRLNISAYDKDELKDNITIKVFVKDVNNHPPIFVKSWYNFDIEESSFSRKFLGKIEARDSDFAQNANVSYRIQPRNDDKLPFSISEYTGVLSTNGKLDRETKDKYQFLVIAYDNPSNGKRLSSSVNVDVNILDINDNAPIFYGYDDIIPYHLQDFEKFRGHAFAESIQVPVYYAHAAENAPVGTPITKVFANDSDFSGNGNGLLLFSIPQRKNKENLFAIDSKEGIVTAIGKLDFEKQITYNVTIIASDLGSPSLSSIALVSVNIIDVPEDMKTAEQPVFTHRYYEVEVEENVPVPLKLLTLNVTDAYKGHRLRYSIVAEKHSLIRRTFKIDSRNGTIFIIDSPDREKRSSYELIIKVDEYKVGRDMTVMVYPVTNERLGDLGCL